MALTDQNIQFLQGQVQSRCEKGDTTKIYNPKTGQKYKVINKQSGTTQAIAVAPVHKDGTVDYGQTSIAVYGTQPGLNKSTENAIKAFGGMTPQYKDIEQFYQATAKTVAKHNGEITNMSGYSQSGPAVAKVAAKHKVGKITNFMDWGAQAAYDHGDITKKEKTYLDKHATVYTDSDKDLTWANKGGKIPYGKQVVVEGRHDLNLIGDHNYAYAHIKGNGPDVNWYIKKHQFCSGMTKEQVERVAQYKAKHDLNPLKGKQDYLKDYKAFYGGYTTAQKTKITKGALAATGVAASAVVGVSAKKAGKGKSAARMQSGSKRILMKKAQLTALADQTAEASKAFDHEVNQKLEEAKASVQEIIDRTRAQAYDIAQHLSAGEVEELLSVLSFDQVWDTGAEEANRAEAKAYTQKVEQLSENLKTTADKLEEADLEEAGQMDLF